MGVAALRGKWITRSLTEAGLAGDAGLPRNLQRQRRVLEEVRGGHLAGMGARMPSVFGQVVLEHVAGAGVRPLAQEGAVDLEEAMGWLGDVSNMWAAETSQKRRNLWGRLQGNVAADSSYGGSGGVVCSGNRSHTAGPIKLRKSVVRHVLTLGARAATSSQLSGSSGRKARPFRSNKLDRLEGETAGVGEQANTGSEVGGSRMLEDCIEVGGGTEADVPSVHLVGKGRSDHRLGDDTEASPGRPVCRVEMGGDPGRFGR